MRTPSWENHRTVLGTLNLPAALEDARAGLPPLPFPEEAAAYLAEVEALKPVVSRQLAAVVLIEAERRGKVGK